MNDLQIFSNPDFGEVRTVKIDDEIWFVLRDVCNILAINGTSDVAARLEKDEVDFTDVVDCRGQTQQTYIVSEPGLYNVIIRSDKPQAKPFTRWITHDVIPTIRKTGSYNLPQLTPNEMMLQIAQNAVEMEKRVNGLEENQTRLESKLDTALQVFSRPNIDHWKADVENKIDAIVESQRLSPVAFRGKLYRELEQTANARLQNRLSHLKGRMKRQGASYKERQAMSKLDIISKDKQLRAIFEGIVARQQAAYGIQGNLQ